MTRDYGTMRPRDYETTRQHDHKRSCGLVVLWSPRSLTTVAVQRSEGMIEDVVSHLPAQDDAFGLIESPMNAEIDAALAVLFLSLRERREAAREQRTYVSVVAVG